jgi:hypothetical protein
LHIGEGVKNGKNNISEENTKKYIQNIKFKILFS